MHRLRTAHFKGSGLLLLHSAWTSPWAQGFQHDKACQLDLMLEISCSADNLRHQAHISAAAWQIKLCCEGSCLTTAYLCAIQADASVCRSFFCVIERQSGPWMVPICGPVCVHPL